MKVSLSRRLLAAFALAATFAAATPAAALDIDLSQTLAATPKTAQAIALLCKRACLGNQRKSWLEIGGRPRRDERLDGHIGAEAAQQAGGSRRHALRRDGDGQGRRRPVVGGLRDH